MGFLDIDDEFSGFSKKKDLEEDEFYYDSSGFVVFTEKYLLKRGFCCKNGCRHCPYGFDKKSGTIKKKI